MMWTRFIATLLFPGLALGLTDWEDHVLVYNFMDTMAQSTCTALASHTDLRVWAIRHQCQTSNLNCAQVCKASSLQCGTGLYVYKKPKLLKANPDPGVQPDASVQALSIQRFKVSDACTMTGCGPNYCCCYEEVQPIHPL